MIKYLRDDKYQIFWLIFHALIGFASVTTKYVLIAWFYIVIISVLISIFAGKERQINIICFLGYLLGIEVLARGLSAAPYIPHEVGKYTVFFFFLLGLIVGGPVKKVSVYGAAMLLLSIPAVLLTPISTKAFVFNYLGPLGLFLGVIFCSRQIITYKQFKELCRVMVYSVFTLACYAIFRASTFEKIEYNLLANFESSGGSITNQVSTLFGTAICIIMLLFLTGQQMFKYKWMDLSILLLFIIRGLLSFSRGGMISAVLTLLLVVFLPKPKNAFTDSEVRIRKISPLSIFVILFLTAGSFFLVNAMTNNFLLYRYQGKTQKALETGFDNRADIDQISAGRYNVMMSDLNMFMAYPALGVGVGQSPRLRHLYGGGTGVTSHLEFSRLLAEHGSLGLVIVIMMFIYPFFKMLGEPNYYRRIIMAVFLVMGLSVTFHNAMRTMITPLFFAFAFLNIVPTDYDLMTGKKPKIRLPYLKR
jgi:hypothetical protein